MLDTQTCNDLDDGFPEPVAPFLGDMDDDSIGECGDEKVVEDDDDELWTHEESDNAYDKTGDDDDNDESPGCGKSR